MDITTGFLSILIVFCLGYGGVALYQDTTSEPTPKTEQHTENTIIWDKIE